MEGSSDETVTVQSGLLDALDPLEGTLLHIGPPKSATTTIQVALSRVRDELAERGVLYPGPRYNHNSLAAWASGAEPGSDDDSDAQSALAAVTAGHGRLKVLSGEHLAGLDETQARAVVGALPQPVHVLLTLRTMTASLPSMWQQWVKGGGALTMSEWVDGCLRGDEELPGYRWDDDHDLVSRWAGVVGAEAMTVVYLDPADRAMIYRVFERLLGIEPHLLSAEDRNAGASLEEIEYIRALGSRFVDARDDDEVRPLLLTGFSRGVRGRTGGEGSPIVLPEGQVEPVRAIARAIASTVDRLGVRTIGSVDDYTAPPRSTMSPTAGPPAEVSMDVAASSVAQLLERAATPPYRLFEKATAPSSGDSLEGGDSLVPQPRGLRGRLLNVRGDARGHRRDTIVVESPGLSVGPREAAAASGASQAAVVTVVERDGRLLVASSPSSEPGDRRERVWAGEALVGADERRIAELRAAADRKARLSVHVAPAIDRLYGLWVEEISRGSTERWVAFVKAATLHDDGTPRTDSELIRGDSAVARWLGAYPHARSTVTVWSSPLDNARGQGPGQGLAPRFVEPELMEIRRAVNGRLVALPDGPPDPQVVTEVLARLAQGLGFTADGDRRVPKRVPAAVGEACRASDHRLRETVASSRAMVVGDLHCLDVDHNPPVGEPGPVVVPSVIELAYRAILAATHRDA